MGDFFSFPMIKKNKRGMKEGCEREVGCGDLANEAATPRSGDGPAANKCNGEKRAKESCDIVCSQKQLELLSILTHTRACAHAHTHTIVFRHSISLVLI